MTDLAQLGLSLAAQPMLTGLEAVETKLNEVAAAAEGLQTKVKTATGKMAADFKNIGAGDMAGNVSKQANSAVGVFQKASSQIRSIIAQRVKDTTADYEAGFKIQLNSALANTRAEMAVAEKASRERIALEKATQKELASIEAERSRQSMSNLMQPILSTGSHGLPTAATSAFAPSAQAAPMFTASGIASVDKMRESLAKLRVEEAALHAARDAGTISHLEYARGLDGITKATNLAVAGNTRARGAFRQTASAIASATFEITGAVYGLTATFAILASPAVFGFKLLSTLEQTKLGMAAILVSMGEINGEAVKLPMALQIAAGMAQRLQENALKFGVSLTALADTTRSIMAPGLGAGMNLQQIEKIALAGSIAVKTIGLDSRQSVQEIRDLVAGGIQAASSTLANALGINDKILKEWKAAGTQYQNLMERLGGFMDTATLNATTLSGAWEIFTQKIQLALANTELFDAFKQKLVELSNWIGKVDVNSGKFQFNPDVINSIKTYYENFRLVLDVLHEVGKFVGPVLGPAIQAMSVLLVNTLYVIRMFAGEIKTLATQLVAIAHLDFKGAKVIGEDWAKEAAAARVEVDKLSRSLLGLKEVQNGGSSLLNKWGSGAASPWSKIDPALLVTGKPEAGLADKAAKAKKGPNLETLFDQDILQGMKDAEKELDNFSKARETDQLVWDDYQKTLGEVTKQQKEYEDQTKKDTEALQDIIDPTAKYIRQLDELDKKYSGVTDPVMLDRLALVRLEINAQADAAGNLKDKVKEAASEMSEFAKNLAKGFQDAITDFLVNPFEKGMKGMVQSFGQMIQKLIAQAVAADLTKKLFGEAGGAAKGSGGGLLDIAFKFLGGIMSANGNAFAGGMPVQQFAMGGIPSLSSLSGSMLTRPTMFGIGGEAGAEAVMPLKRGSDGKLGVASRGSQAPAMTFNFSMPGIRDAREAKQADGAIRRSVLTAISQSQRYK